MLAVLIAASVFVIGFSATGDEKTKSTAGMVRTDNIKPKMINIVYDDSGSMVNGDEEDAAKGHIDRWAQAKYSLETFISMLDDKDSLNIYTMSGEGKRYTTIEGKNKAKSVKKIHSDFKTGDYTVVTPIKTLDSAYDDLKKSGKDYEKWLIVLTDGAFTNAVGSPLPTKEVSKTINKYGKELGGNLIYIPIQTEKDLVYTSKEFTTLEVPKKTDKEKTILKQLLKAAGQIYSQRDEIECKASGRTATIQTGGISMSKLIIFAQGSGAEIEAIDSGKISENIGVKYTEADDAVNYNGKKPSFESCKNLIKTNKNLQGAVATVTPSESGGYITSESKITVTFDEESKITDCVAYFVPAVELQYELKEADSDTVWLSSKDTNPSSHPCISPGNYVFTADVIDSGNGKEHLDKNPKLSPVELYVTIGGREYSLNELQEGVPLELKNTDDLKDVTAEAYVMNRKYKVDTSNLLDLFGNTVVKITYKLKVDFSKEKSASLLDFKFGKTDFLLHSLNKIKKTDDMIKATVSCVDDNDNPVPITNEIWQMVKAAQENGGTINDETSFYVGNRSDDEETNVNYDVVFEDSVTKDGKGIFYVCPRYATDEKGRIDKKHTTHQNYIHRNVMCNVSAEISIPNVTDKLAYSTTPTAIADKSGPYAIALCMWHTIVTLFLFFWCLGYVLKRKLPKVKKGTVTNTECRTKILNRRGKPEWNQADEFYYDEQSTVYITKKLSTVLIPYISQKGEIKLKTEFPKLRIEATEMFGKRSRVRLLNSPSNFESINGNSSIDENNQYVTIKGSNITKEFLESKKKKKFEFSTSQSLITFGGFDGGVFRRYSLSFRNKKSKKKGKKK